MEILYGIVLLVVFVMGVAIGIFIPHFIKKYIQELNNNEFKKTEEQLNKAENLTPDMIEEWQNGLEGVRNE